MIQFQVNMYLGKIINPDEGNFVADRSRLLKTKNNVNIDKCVEIHQIYIKPI